jgi:basic amino acid/polyamine antiporter, APA family
VKTEKKLSLLDCLMLIMGSMIGSGIFIVPAAMSRELGSPGMLLIAWLLTGLFTVMAALSYGELAAMMPKAGGQYIYLREAYGKLFGFLYGWTFFAVIQTGTIAAVAVAFAKFSGVFIPYISSKPIVTLFSLNITTQQLLAIIIVWLLTVFNFGNVKSGAMLQNVFTFTKIAAIVLMIIAGGYLLINSEHRSVDYFKHSDTSFSFSFLTLFSAALVGSIFSSDAWNNVTFTGGEIQQPQRTLPISLLLGTSAVMLLYFFINWMYVQVLPFDAIANAENDRVGTVFMQYIFGNLGLYVMAAFIMISTFGCINGLTLSGARVYYAMAQDGLFFVKAASLNNKQSPQFALIIQAIWTSLLTLSGSYGDLLDYVVFAVLLFYIITVGGVFMLRKKMPNAPRPYKVWGYPILPAMYILIALFICISLLIQKPEYTYPGLAIVLAGIPVYYLLSKK